jgi:Carboxypeptidase regulatory-like domain/TonB-dependent Receptor Plug Domain
MMHRTRLVLPVVVILFLLAGNSNVFGQATGTMLGAVTDASGASIPGAAVTVQSQDTGLSRTVQTDASGEYRVPFLPVGHYTIRVSFTGFQPAVQKDVTLQVDESREVDFKLNPAAVHQQVEVSATPVAVDTSNPTLGQVITSQQVAQLPLNGRDFVQLATLTPGVTTETNTNSFYNGGGSSETSIRGSYSLSVGGSAANSTDWLLDGVDNNEMTAGAIAILPSIDAIQEFKVLTFNYSAEYGTRGGPTVLVTTKSGTNQFHGTLFEFLRNTALDARSFFAQNREQFNENEFGGSLGGPIKKDKTFFFVDYQGRYLSEGITHVGQVPTAAMRQGDFSQSFPDSPAAQIYNPFSTATVNGQVTRAPFMCDSGGNPMPVNAGGTQAAGTPCNRIPQALINPIAQKMMSLYPLPNNLASGLLGTDWIASPAKHLKEGEWDIRLDHNFSSKDSLFARFSYDQATEFLPSGMPGFANADGFSSTQSLADHGRNAALSETHIFSPTSINQATLGFNRIFNHILSYGSGSCESEKLGIPGANLGGISCGLTDTTFTGGFWALGDRGFAPFQGGTNVYFIKDSFDAIRGNHNINFGGEIRANQMNVDTNSFQDGYWIFSNLYTAQVVNGANSGAGGNPMADFLLGLPDLGLHDQTFDGTTTGRRWKMFRPFIQDDWRVTPALTLNLGLAYALVTPITEEHNRQTNFDFETGKFLIAGQTSGAAIGIPMDTTAFEPRFGFAWSPRGDRKMSIRGGYGIFHDSSWNQGANGTWENPPFFEESAFFADELFPSTTRTISQGFPLLTQPTNPSTFGGSLWAQNLNFKLGMIQQFNLNVQRELPGDLLFTVGYAGSRSTNLLTSGFNLNSPVPQGSGKPALPPPYPQYGNITGILDNGFSRYDSLQVKAETKNTRHGLYALVGYTYARTWDTSLVDNLSGGLGVTYYPLPFGPNEDKGFSPIQLNHDFTASVVYNLPFGKGKQFGSTWSGATNAVLGNWEVNVIEHITSGFPLAMSTTNNSGAVFVNNSNRPDRVCNGRLANWTVQDFFQTNCFVDPPPGTLGNAARTPLFGPSFVNTDFSAIKDIPLRESLSLQFRAEVFNLFNTPQFAQPGTFVDAPNFGQITSTVNNPRLIQFALKLIF